MRILLDTHLLLWLAARADRVPRRARELIEDDASELWFSVVSIWEVVIKRQRPRDDFDADPTRLRDGLLSNGYSELGVVGAHALQAHGLPLLHKDPFDRMLVAQARAEGLTLLTVDRTLVRYGAPVQLA